MTVHTCTGGGGAADQGVAQVGGGRKRPQAAAAQLEIRFQLGAIDHVINS